MKQRLIINKYYNCFRGLKFFPISGSGIFEIDTSRMSEFVRWIAEWATDLEHGKSKDDRKTSRLKGYFVFLTILSFIPREIFKWTVIWFMGRFWYKKRQLHIDLLGRSQRLFIGFCVYELDRFSAKDFRGFVSEKQSRVETNLNLVLKLPSVKWKDYIAGDDRSLPIFAYIKFNQVIKTVFNQIQLLKSLMAQFEVGHPILIQHATDLKNGHTIASVLISLSISNILHNHTKSLVITLPFERHDWEQLIIHNLKSRFRIEAVQACTFSPNDLNMYVVDTRLPCLHYRTVSPHQIYSINKKWSVIISKRLGANTSISVLRKNRFSGINYAIQFSKASRVVLYISGINPRKTELDINVLLSCRDNIIVQARVHPSIKNYLVNSSRVKYCADISDTYLACVYADTSMVFQLVCDRSRLVYISHTVIQDQNPTDWFSNYGTMKIKYSLLSQHIETLVSTDVKEKQNVDFGEHSDLTVDL